MKTTKILVQKSETGLSEDNKAKLKSLEIYKDKKHFKFSNGWVDLAYYIKLRTFYKNYIYLIINSLRLHSKSHQKSLFLEVFGLVEKNNFIKLA